MMGPLSAKKSQAKLAKCSECGIDTNISWAHAPRLGAGFGGSTDAGAANLFENGKALYFAVEAKSEIAMARATARSGLAAGRDRLRQLLARLKVYSARKIELLPYRNRRVSQLSDQLNVMRRGGGNSLALPFLRHEVRPVWTCYAPAKEPPPPCSGGLFVARNPASELGCPYGQKIETAQRRQRSNIFGLGPVLHNKLAVDA
jgi:hypothetical protein